MLDPDRNAFDADPIGYSGLGRHKWETARLYSDPGYIPREQPSKEDLKNPILWLCHAKALMEAALVLLQKEPSWETMPVIIRGVCDCQYCAVALMLTGYSLETCLKAMLILTHGVDQYLAREKEFHHHRLEKLADFITDLSEKDRAILRALTHFTMWAGRYPDPGSDKIGHTSEIFSLSERHKISAHDLYTLANRILLHVREITS